METASTFSPGGRQSPHLRVYLVLPSLIVLIVRAESGALVQPLHMLLLAYRLLGDILGYTAPIASSLSLWMHLHISIAND